MQLYIVDTRLSGSDHETPRILAILHALHRAIITSPSPLPDTEFSFSTSDIADPDHLKRTIWALSRTADEEEKWLMSDFGYWSWPLNLIGGYEQVRQQIARTEPEFHMKKKQAVWRGALKTNKHRQELLRVTENKEWADVKSIEWSSAADPKVSDGSKPISMAEHCQYQFLIHTEGMSFKPNSCPSLSKRSIPRLVPTKRPPTMSLKATANIQPRTKLLRPRKIPPKLQLRHHNARPHLARTPPRPPCPLRPAAELRRGQRRLFGLGRKDGISPSQPTKSVRHRPSQRSDVQRSLSDAGGADVLLAALDYGMGECWFCA